MTKELEADLSAYEADAAAPESVSTVNILAQITAAARELREAQRDVEAAETALKAAQDRVRHLTEFQLPQMMDEARQKSLTTEDNFQIERGEVVRASISAENMPAAVMWLNANGHPIAKHGVSLQFDKDEEQEAARAVETLRKASFVPTDKYTVHPQTLGALVRELMKDGKDFPKDLLGVYVQPIIKMKDLNQPKNGKAKGRS